MTLLARGDAPPDPPGVGVWFDLRNPPAWRQDPARLYGFTLELCEEAEHLGADSVRFSEHHGFEDGYLPQPLTFAAAAAARTSRVRLGTGILVAPLRKTAQLAEEAAVVDIISGGRLDLGLGAGYRPPEFELFGTDFAARYRRWTSRSANCADYGSTTASPRPQYNASCPSGSATRARKAPAGRAGWARACSPWPRPPGRRTATAWPRAATTRPRPGWAAESRPT